MTTYYIEHNGQIVLFDNDYQKIRDTLDFMPEYANNPILETTRPIEDFMFADTSEFKQEQQRKKEEWIKSLTLTKREFTLSLSERGIGYSQLKELISSNEQAQLEWELCVELVRSNPLLDTMGAELGLSPQDIDEIFVEKAGG